MAFSKKRIIFGGLGTALAAGIAIASSNKSNIDETAPEKPQHEQIVTKIKVGVKYKSSLIEGSEHLWNDRFEELKRDNPKHEELIKAKDLKDGTGPLRVREVCNGIIASDEDTEWLDDFQKFCTMKNKDNAHLITDKNGFAAKYSDFSRAGKDKLSKGFASIWEHKGDKVNEVWKEKMLDKCRSLQDKMYVGDAEDDDFEKYCQKPAWG
ncbi:hypothetical protein A6V39_04215 [Candidatus Mycoplasma haematobovis]|uniref:Uncharacterized protein n=1 Tax=Candidatus Mycoplasma haematobovis TaxID=432608 RepID=A0A1A9QDL2_9MOLU|nr:hypothetical protein [Candidatus Mycoplasma haematobovis]OAL10091.1 hypothetical protein A6V39_04215 [Candidatus Mycoplasma haematobovis]